MGVGADRIAWIPNGVEYGRPRHRYDRRALKTQVLNNGDKQVVRFQLVLGAASHVSRLS